MTVYDSQVAIWTALYGRYLSGGYGYSIRFFLVVNRLQIGYIYFPGPPVLCGPLITESSRVRVASRDPA